MSHRILCSLLTSLAAVSGCARYAPMPLDPAGASVPPPSVLRVQAREIHHPLLQPVALDFDVGLTPDGAAVLAVLANPALRSERDRRGVNTAQLLQAQLLPNPQIGGSFGVVTGHTAGTVSPWDALVNWDITGLIPRQARIAALTAGAESIELDIAWVEWQAAETAKTAVFDRVALDAQLRVAEDVDRRLEENRKLMEGAVNRHERLVLDLAAAQAASQDAHAVVLGLRQQIGHQRLVLLKAIGMPPDAQLKLDPSIALPARLTGLPTRNELLRGIEDRRLDLLALRRGYDSQEQALRAAVLAQFPKLNVGYTHARDNTAVVSEAIGITVDLPIFDRNQGGIAAETASRRRLFDEFNNRVYQAKFEIAMAFDDIAAVTDQIIAVESAIPDLERLVETYREALQRGNADVLSFYAAQNNVAQKRLSLLKLKQQLIDDRIALELASGRFLPMAPPAMQPATKPTSRLSTPEGPK